MTEPTPQRALAELLDLAEATRPDIDRDDLQAAVIAWTEVDRSWGQILVAVAGMLARGEEPRDLRNAVAQLPRAAITRKEAGDA